LDDTKKPSAIYSENYYLKENNNILTKQTRDERGGEERNVSNAQPAERLAPRVRSGSVGREV